MQCSHCQTENAAGASFCDECGAALDAPCSHCGEPNRPNAKFCRKCGGRLGTADAAAAESSGGKTVVPKHLAEKILASRRFIEGERKQVTVLFADIRGSTGVIEKLDPEEVRKYFDPVLHIMMDAVHRYEGTVNQVLGDGIMALFGAPLTHEDHALRACYAALAMQEAMRRDEDNARGALKIGIGINSGEVVVRSITNDLSIDYSALGHTTHLAARMESLAGAGSIVMTTDTLREVEGFVEVRSLGARELKGFSTAVQAFELTGVTSARTRLQAQAARGLSSFVGRQAEIEIFRRLVSEADAGAGRVLALVGEAGMGKSRLVRELLQSHLPADWKVVQAFSVSYGKATPFFPVIELLRSYFAVAAGEDKQATRTKILQRMMALDPSLRAAAPAILALLDAMPDGSAADLAGYDGVAEAIAAFERAELQQRRTQTFDALKQLLLRESEAQPLLVLFEDLHWIDSETQTFLDLLVESVPAARMLLLVNYRPGYSHLWAARDYYMLIRLEPLPPSGADELLASLVGEGSELASLRELLIKRTGGNPFFIEEIVRSLVETGALVGERGAYKLGAPIDSLRVPSTVRTVLAERVDRLPAAEKQLLQTASVIGVVVLVRLLRAVTGLPQEELQRYLFNLQAAEFIFESNLFPELEYTFKHALVDEVVYGALLHERRIMLHASIVRALEQIAGDDPAQHIEALAYHAAQAELWAAAVRYYRQAAAKAMSRSAFLEAVGNYRKALAALAHLPATPARLAEEIDLHLDARNVLFLLGDANGVAEHLQTAEPLAEQLGDEQRLARVLNFLNSYYGLAGDPERAIEIGQRALKLGAIQADVASSTVTYYYLGAAYNKTGQYDLAIDVLSRGIDNIGTERRHERFGTAAVLSVICRSHLTQCLSATGRFAEGMRRGEEGVRLGEEVQHATSLIHMLCSLGILHLLQGNCARAIPILERSLALCGTAKIPVYVPMVASRLGGAYAQAGRLEEALPCLEQGVESTAGRAAFLSLNMASLAEGYLLLDRVDEAQRCAERALELARQYKERGHQAWTLKVLGDIAMHENRRDLARAAAHYREARGLSEELGMRPLTAHCRVGIALVEAESGALHAARTEIASARAEYEAMGMSRWRERAAAVLDGFSQ